MKTIIEELINKNIKIAIAESMTGGYLSSLITKEAGASNVFVGAIIAYTKQMKVNLLKVDEKVIDKYSSVSIEVVNEMNYGLQKIIEADLYIAITGNAGPSFEVNTNELKCYILIEYSGKKHYKVIKFESKKRFRNIKKASFEIISLLRTII